MQTSRQPSSAGATAAAQPPHVGSGSNHTGDNANWVQAQTKVFSRWIEHVILAAEPNSDFHLSGTNLVQELKSGHVLARLLRALTRRALPFNIDQSQAPFAILNRLEQLLSYTKREGVQHTCSPSDVYNSNSTQVLGLVWLIIYNFQNINKSDLLHWVSEKLKPYVAKMGGSNVRDFTTSWQSGIALCALIHSLSGDSTIDMDAIMSMSPAARVQMALQKAAEAPLQIPALLEPHDMTDAPIEAVIMTYLSSIHNKTTHGSIVKEKDDSAKPAPVKRPSFSRISAPSSPGLPVPSSGPRKSDADQSRSSVPRKSDADDQIALLKARIEILEKEEIELRQKRIRELEAELLQKEAALLAATAKAASVCAKCDNHQIQLTQLQATVAEKEAELAKVTLLSAGESAKVAKLEKSNNQLLEQLENLERSQTESIAKIAQKDSVIEQLEASIAQAATASPRDSSESKKLKKDLEKQKKKVAELETELAAALAGEAAKDSRIVELEGSNAKLVAEIESLSSERSTASADASGAMSPRRDKERSKEKSKSKKKKRSSQRSSKRGDEPEAEVPSKELVEAQKEAERLKLEVKKNQQTMMTQDDEIRALKEKNASLISSMKNELKTLLQRQQDDADMISLLRQKVASYSSELITLQTLIREKGLTDVDKLEQELNKLQKQNEELNKRIAALEKDMLDAQRKAEALSEDLYKEVTPETPGGVVPSNLREQLDAAHKRIQTLLEWRKAAITELNSIRVDNDELTQLLKILDKKIKEINRASSAPKDDNFLATYEQTNTEVNMSLNDVIAWTSTRFDQLKERIDRIQAPQQ
eukprot:TRINITY_DN581_c0_g2_i1.p1 TRINITY_DN581_c0_g2~~TRINITY_DN581_c0_g2_i1.p1  ORF type:complete len:819 (-),score=174.66 TRINITY_DN581_c0_g2_i1:58-2514(-)